jgi:imidazolonepropionase
VIDATRSVVMPGLVDCGVPLIRTTQDLSPRALKTLALEAIEEGVRYGTTAFGPRAADLKILRVHAALKELPLTLVSTFSAGSAGEHLLPALKRRKLAEFIEIRGEDGVFAAMAQAIGLGVKVSAAIALAVQMGAVSVDDVVAATERDAVLLAQSRTIAMLSPDAAPARLLIASGAAIALASGGEAANMQMALALACRALNMTPAEAITASTINAAHAIGRAPGIGSIEAGKSADLVIFDVPDYRELANHFGVNLAKLVMIRGNVLVEKPRVNWPSESWRYNES